MTDETDEARKQALAYARKLGIFWTNYGASEEAIMAAFQKKGVEPDVAREAYAETRRWHEAHLAKMREAATKVRIVCHEESPKKLDWRVRNAAAGWPSTDDVDQLEMRISALLDKGEQDES